jgi:hypothetical protein
MRQNETILDSGSMVSVLPVKLVRQFGMKPTKSIRIVRGAGRHRVDHFGTCVAELIVGGVTVRIDFEFADVSVVLFSVP